MKNENELALQLAEINIITGRWIHTYMYTYIQVKLNSILVTELKCLAVYYKSHMDANARSK